MWTKQTLSFCTFPFNDENVPICWKSDGLYRRRSSAIDRAQCFWTVLLLAELVLVAVVVAVQCNSYDLSKYLMGRTAAADQVLQRQTTDTTFK